MRRIFVFLLALIFSVYSFGQALPVTPMQNAVGGVIKQRISQRGFAANDPRFGLTLQGAGSTIAGAALSAAVVTAAGVTAPAWVTAAVGVGLAALFAAGISLAVDGVRWFFNRDGSVSAPGGSRPALVAGGPFYSTRQINSAIGPDPLSAVQGAIAGSGFTAGEVRQTTPYIIWYLDLGDYKEASTIPVSYYSSGAPASCGPGQVYMNEACTDIPLPSTSGTKYSNVSDAVASLSPAEKAKPVNPSIIAAVADNAWKQAASVPGYAGVPYEFNNPITEADAQSWQAANPDAWPTVGDLVAPQPVPAGGTAASPWQLPSATSPVSSVPAVGGSTGASGGTSTVTNPGSGEQVNLGPDPGVGAPGLENIPTAAQILAPLLGLFPELRNFALPSHQASCPTASFSLFGRDLVLDEHCRVLEVARPTLVAVMAAVWVAVGLFVLLAA